MLVVFAAAAVTEAQGQVLANSTPTIDLDRPTGNTPMTVTYHPTYDQYYAHTGGNPTFPSFVYDSSGTVLQNTAINLDVRSVFYNSNTGVLECATYNALNGGTNYGFMEVDLDSNGLYLSTYSLILSSMPGLQSAQSMPSYNPTLDELYTHTAGNGRTVRVASRQTGQLLNTISLTGGTLNSVVSNWIGFDETFQMFIHWDHSARMARVFDINGQYVGSCAIPNVSSPNTLYGAGYTNGQLFVFDSATNRWEGHRILKDVEIEVQRPLGTPIAHQDEDQLTQQPVVGDPFQLTYTIENTGNDPLDLTGTPLVQFDDELNCDVSLIATPATPVPGNDVTDFTIEVVAQSVGDFSFDLLIPNEVANKSPYRVTVRGTAVAPGILVLRDGVAVWPGGSDHVGGHTSSSLNVTYTIENVGGSELTLTGVSLANPGNVDATVVAQPAVSVAVGTSTNFTIGLTPDDAGIYGVDVLVESDAHNLETYGFRLTGDSQQPGYAVLRLTRIGQIPVDSGGTDALGSLITGQPISYTWTVHNDGASDLSLDNVGISSQVNASVTIDSAPSGIAPNQSAPLTLTLTAPADGAVTFNLELESNDTQHDPFVAHIEAEAVDATAAAAHITVWRAGAWLESGVPESIGIAAAGKTVYLAYVVASNGPNPLDLTLPVAITSSNCTVTVIQEPQQTLDPHGGHDVLLLRVDIESDAAAEFDVSLANSSANADPFVIAGDFLYQVPRLEVRRPAFHALPHGSSQNLGVATAGSRTIELSLFNTGDAALTLTSQPWVENVESATVEIGTPGAMTIQPGESTTLEVSIQPFPGNTLRFDVIVESNDAFAGSPYVVTFTGWTPRIITAQGRGCSTIIDKPAQAAAAWLLLGTLALLALTRTRRRPTSLADKTLG